MFSLPVAISTVNSWTLSRITDPLQDGRLSRICSSYDEDSELDIWKAALFSIHWIGIRWRDGARAREGLIGTHWIGIRWIDGARVGLIGIHWIGIRWSEGARATAGQIGTHVRYASESLEKSGSGEVRKRSVVHTPRSIPVFFMMS